MGGEQPQKSLRPVGPTIDELIGRPNCLCVCPLMRPHSVGATPATSGASLQVVEVFGRGAVTEDAQVVDKLHSHIPADGKVGGVADVVATHRAAEVLVLVKDVVHADAQLAPAVAEYLFADEGVAEQILLVVVIRKAEILVV